MASEGVHDEGSVGRKRKRRADAADTERSATKRRRVERQAVEGAAGVRSNPNFMRLLQEQGLLRGDVGQSADDRDIEYYQRKLGRRERKNTKDGLDGALACSVGAVEAHSSSCHPAE